LSYVFPISDDPPFPKSLDIYRTRAMFYPNHYPLFVRVHLLPHLKCLRWFDASPIVAGKMEGKFSGHGGYGQTPPGLGAIPVAIPRPCKACMGAP